MEQFIAENDNIQILDKDGTIVKVYKQLPSIPNLLTKIGLVFLTIIVPVLVLLAYIADAIPSSTRDDSGMDMVMLAETIHFFVQIIIIPILSVVSLYGIYRMRRWGLITYIVCKCAGVLEIFLLADYIEPSSGSFVHTIIIVIYLCTFIFEESGHNTFDILMHNGVVEED